MEQELLNLRSMVVDSARELALHGDVAAETRLNILMELARNDDSPAESLARAFEAAKAIGADDDKLNAFLDILYEIDARLTPVSVDDGSVSAQNDNRLPSEPSQIPADHSSTDSQEQ